MFTALIVVHVIACCAVIMVVLLSKGKGADLGAAFGGSSQTVFGSQGAGGVLTKLVAVCVGVFMMTSLGLTYLTSHRVQSSVMRETERAVPAVPAPGSALDASSQSGSQPVSQEPGPTTSDTGREAAK